MSVQRVSAHRQLTRLSQILVPFILLLFLWVLAANAFNNPQILPSPLAVVETFFTHLSEGDPRGRSSLFHLQKTLFRVVVASSIAIVLALALGVLMATKDTVEDGLLGWVPVWMTLPDVVVILVAMVMFRYTEMSIFVSVIFVATPFGMVNFWEGAKDVDADLLEMAQSFEASNYSIWRNIIIPHLLPYVFGTTRYILSLCWKLVVLAEVFGIATGIGSMFRYYFETGDVAGILAYVLLFLIVIFVIEYVIINSLKARVFAWRA